MVDTSKTKEQLATEIADLHHQLEKTTQDLDLYKNELRQSEEEFRTFTYVVSHDLRTPLINLKGFSAELQYALDDIRPLLETLSSHLTEEQQEQLTRALDQDIPESLEFIAFSVSRVDQFIAAILKLSRLSRREIRLTTLDMNVVTQKVLDTLSDKIAERDVETIYQDLPEIIADALSLEQVLEILLDNAIIYLVPDRPGKIEVSAQEDEDHYIFSVCDNGRGIAEDDYDKVFAPFRRAGKENAPGNGMGLIYAKNLVRRHGGKIEFTSELGVGTTFTFTISKGLTKGAGNGE